MNKKKLLAMLLCAAMLLSLLAACGGSDKSGAGVADADVQAGEPADGEDIQEGDGQSSGGSESLTAVPMGQSSGFVIDLPAGYRYDDAWSCYSSDSTGVRIWVGDANFYDTENEFSNALENYGDDLKEQELDGAIFAWKHEDPAGFYGAETHYCIELGSWYQAKSGCHLMVTSESGDMASTQSAEIIEALKSIRLEGEEVGARAADFAKINADPYESLIIDFTPEETAAMSTFMSFGRYAVDGNTVYGQAFDSAGTVELVRIDLETNGSFAEPASHVVLEKGHAPKYVSLYGDDVYYIHDSESGIYRVGKDGGEPELIVPDGADYLQIHNGKLYYCDESYTFCSAELDGSGAAPVFEKEVYFPYFVNDQWFIYQDDADYETLHLRHEFSGEDIPITFNPTYSPVIYGTDMYCQLLVESVNILSKVDMSYDPAAVENFNGESGTRPESQYITIGADGYLYFGLDYGLSLDRWKEAENPEALYDVIYRYLGSDYEIYWEYDDSGLISGIYVKLVSSGNSQSLPRFD